MGDGAPVDILIESTRGPDDAPVCALVYDGRRSYPPSEDVRATALDLIVTAADAEACVLLSGLGLPPEVITAFVEDLLRRRGKKFYGTRSTIRIAPAASTRTGLAWVLLLRPGGGGHDGALTPDEARRMARDWLEVAAGTDSDQLLAEALRACTTITPAETQSLYAYMAALRAKRDRSGLSCRVRHGAVPRAEASRPGSTGIRGRGAASPLRARPAAGGGGGSLTSGGWPAVGPQIYPPPRGRHRPGGFSSPRSQNSPGSSQTRAASPGGRIPRASMCP